MSQLGEAFAEAGELGRSESVLADAIGAARSAGDPGSEARARIRRLGVGLLREPERTWTTAISDAEELVTIFEELDDQTGLAQAWLLIGQVLYWCGQVIRAESAYERAIEHAHRAGDRRAEAEGLAWLSSATYRGPTPVRQGLRRCDAILERGQVDEAVAAAEQAVRLYEEKGNIVSAEQGRALLADLRVP